MRLVTFGIDEKDRLVVCFPIFVKDFCKVICVNTHKPNKDKPALNIDKDRPAKYTKINKAVLAEKEMHI